MSYTSYPVNSPGGELRDDQDNVRLRHARKRHHGVALGQYLQPPPLLFTRDGHNVFLGDMYRGGSAFLLCSGPSLTAHDLDQLKQPGIVTCSVNNAATVFRSQLWCCVDDPGNFCDIIWRDPGILKFVPLCHMEKSIKVRDEHQQLMESGEPVGSMPTVFGFRRNEHFVPEQWLYEDTFNWGNHSNQVDDNGNAGSRSVMYVAIRLLFYLGIRRLFLLGCDFRMKHGAHNYAFSQERSKSSVNGNNASYNVLNQRLEMLRPHFQQAGFEIYNCTPNSGLKVFPKIDFADAVELARKELPTRVDTSGMYDQKARKKTAKEKKRSVQPHDLAVPSQILPKWLDEMTIVVPLESDQVRMFQGAWQTWVKSYPFFARIRLLLLCEKNSPLKIRKPKMPGHASDVQVIEKDPNGWFPDEIQQLLDRSGASWFMKLAPNSIASRPSNQFLRHDWFEPWQEKGRSVLVGHAWGYAKPKYVLKTLDAWAESVLPRVEQPELSIQYRPSNDRVYFPTIANWFWLCNRELLASLVASSQDHSKQLGEFSLETILHYWGICHNAVIRRENIKDLGWDHSYGWDANRVIEVSNKLC